MAIYYALGDALVGKDELQSHISDGKLQRFLSDAINLKSGAKHKFISGSATTENILRSIETEDGDVIGFEPIGIGKPLNIHIRHIYTGNKAEGFWGSKDMLVASAMKSIAVYDAAPRAINFLVPKAKKTIATLDMSMQLIKEHH